VALVEGGEGGAAASSAAAAKVIVPVGFIELPGFPGVFVGVRDDVLGTVQDTRPAMPRPSYSYLITLPSLALKEMWKKAVLGQMEALKQAEVRILLAHPMLAAHDVIHDFSCSLNPIFRTAG
jgi:hypothetical protein